MSDQQTTPLPPGNGVLYGPSVDVRRMLAEACREAGSQLAFARSIGVSGAYVCDVLQGRRDPGPAILAAFGLRVVTLYVPQEQPDA